MGKFSHSRFVAQNFRSILGLTEGAALACLSSVGSGDGKTADHRATQALRKGFDKLPIKGQVVIGEGERDKAPMLYIGEKVGQFLNGMPEMDIAVDPLEGTNLCAKALRGACSVLALSQKGGLFKAPDVYMEKIATGPLARQGVDLCQGPAFNIRAVAKALGKKISDVKVALLNRPRHQKLKEDIYKAGAALHLIEDGDLFPSLQTAIGGEGEPSVDLVMGTGGATEGVLSAAALKCLGGGFWGRFVFEKEADRNRALDMGMQDLDRVYERDELVCRPVIFCLSALTANPLLKGISRRGPGVEVESLFMDSLSREVNVVKTFKPVSV